MSFQDRCKEFYQSQGRNAMLRQGDPVQAIMAFVQSEIGRTADHSLEDSKSLILYFLNEADRAEFMAIVREMKPGMYAKDIP